MKKFVRKEEHITLLQKQGEQHVLLLNDEEFENKLKTLAFELNATTAFEAVGGEVTGQIFNAMPEKSEVILYGGLSGKPVSGIDVLDMIFNDKSITGFNLNEWMTSISDEDFEDVSDKLQDLFISKEIVTNIQKSFDLDNVYNALRQYISNMSAGKIIFVF